MLSLCCPKCAYTTHRSEDIPGSEGARIVEDAPEGDFFTLEDAQLKREVHSHLGSYKDSRMVYGCPSCKILFFD